MIKETKKKLGIDASNVEIWTNGNLIVTRGDTSVVPVLGRVKSDLTINSLQIDSDEIKELLIVPLEELCNPTTIGYTQFKNTYAVPVFLGASKRIWGITAVMTNMCLSSILPRSSYSHRIKYLPSIRCNKSLSK